MFNSYVKLPEGTPNLLYAIHITVTIFAGRSFIRLGCGPLTCVKG